MADAVSFDLTVKLGDVLTLLGFLIGGLGFIWTMKGEMKLLTREISIQNDTLKAHSLRLEKVEAVLITQAAHTERLNMMDKRIDELRHGEGFVRGARGIDREY